MNRFESLEPHCMMPSPTGPFVKFSEIERIVKDLKGELRDEYGSNGEFAQVYSTLKIISQRLGIVL